MKILDENKINIVGKRMIFFIIALVLIAVSVVSFIVKGFNLDTDFVGGTTFEFNLDRDATQDDLDKTEAKIKETVTDLSGNVNLQIANGNIVVAKLAGLDASIDQEKINNVSDSVCAELGIDSSNVNTEFVGGTIAGETTKALFLAVLIAILLMLVYITIRFRISTGLSAIICLAHDVTIVLGFYSLFGIPVNSTLIACLLTILGYSINATIIVFDRVRENTRMYPKVPYSKTVNSSIIQTLARSVNTTITTLLTIGMMYILGVSSIREFALPIIVGLFAGLYSSTCLAGSVSTFFVKDKKNA